LGVQLADIVPRRKISLSQLSGRNIAIDAYNALYQFLSVIRGEGGVPLRDHRGNVTSHLSGLFYRTVNLMEKGIKLVYVFDGKPSELKKAELERRASAKKAAAQKYRAALRRGDMEAARVHAQAMSRLTENMVDEAWRLLSLMGVPSVQAPSEGEAQAAYMAQRGDVWAVGSQDYDALLFGAPRLVRNLTISGRRKLPRKNVYVTVDTELVDLDEALTQLGIDLRQLVMVGVLVGTDFNPEGTRGVGPKTALKLVKKFVSIDGLAEHLRDRGFPERYRKIEQIFLNPKVNSDYEIAWREVDVEGVVQFLCGEHNFSEERVRKALDRVTSGIRFDAKLERWF